MSNADTGAGARHAIYLAPMEGLLDSILRDILTQVGGYDRCVSEFIRVTHTLLPVRALLRAVPELECGGCTRAGVPVWPQLLGSDALCLAENAARLSELGAPGLDLNFGCPARVVNRHGGGAMLLRSPQTLWRIAHAVRRAVPAACPVSAKMRLGFEDDSLLLDNALALQDAGVGELVVHARTQAQGYRAPAHWARVADVVEALHIPVAINGEIWDPDDALQALQDSACTQVMLGRGAVARPGLALDVRARLSGGATHFGSWTQVWPLLQDFWSQVGERLDPRQQAGRLKQWLRYLARHYPEAVTALHEVRPLVQPSEVQDWIWSRQCLPG